ncbi:arabinosyltransferase domain-containing protein [Nocardia zapadnayensis]|uniref:arabinosyltransferase domain-containing protein n=1 Tax=Nocardia rhamnosiphila TaxID=426716 RepID=UPI002246E7DD|nr:arabinosyltransferase domain-containing protein [Nocardia zapadnayensis]MCX0272693.1 arabinosyltransferase domain-containing protein [Nocardia zapadnayensis]
MTLTRAEEPVLVSGPATIAPEPSRWWRRIAVVAGLVGAVLAVLVPFLPVNQEQASLSWPQADQSGSVTAPLGSYSPTSVAIGLPCAAAASLGESGGNLLSTVPPQSGQAWHYGLNAVVTPVQDGKRIQIVLRDRTLLDTPVAQLPPDCQVAVTSDSTRISVDTGVGEPVTLLGDHRPQLVGFFTDLADPGAVGVRAEAVIDSRFTTSPSIVKQGVIVAALLATALSLWALHRLDSSDNRRNRRVLPRRWWRPRPIDGVILGILLLWYFIGAGTADDGYIVGMARTAGHAGYLANYFAYFGVPETPIGIPYDYLFGWLAQVSTASIVVRLPELVIAVVCWLLISREVVPRLGVAARTERAAVWAGGLLFLAFWLPYNNGLRPEPAVALGVLLTWVSMERALTTRRLTPAALALIPAALAVVTNPCGLICFAALLAGARPLARIIVHRACSVGYAALIAPALATGLAVLTIVFAGQPIASVTAMLDAHQVVGPNMPWHDEYLVYQNLLQAMPDGSLARRFAMLTMFLALAVSVLALLRYGGRIPGLAAGPTRRIVGTTIAAIPLMMFSPTKFTHHLGVFAGLAGVVAVVAAVAAGPRVLRSPRNRALFAAAVLGVLALSFASSNSWWYVASYGIPWWDKPISVAGISAGTVLLGLSLLTVAAAGWLHTREPFRRPQRRARRPIPALTLAVALVVTFQVASFAKAAADQYPAYSIAKSNFSALGGNPCGLANDVLVEPDPNRRVLKPRSGDPASALGAGTQDGFTPNGINFDDLVPDASDAAAASVGQSLGSTGTTNAGSATSTGPGGVARTGINGSSVPLPFGLDPATTPVLGSYGSPGPKKNLISGWYDLPDPAADGGRGEIIAIAAAGRVASTDLDGLPVAGQGLSVEYGVAEDGGVQPRGQVAPDDVSVLQPSWRNLRIPLAQLPAEADAVRIVASIDSSDSTQWIAVTPPRVPRLQSLDSLVGHTSPVLMDWLVGLQFPCQQPMRHRYGIAETPAYRITPEFSATIMTTNWQSHASGGPLGYTELLTRSEVIPSYLRDDWKRNWGEIHRLVPYDPTATAAPPTTTTVRRSGLWTPGPLNFAIR